jgi:hypothetical protein
LDGNAWAAFQEKKKQAITQKKKDCASGVEVQSSLNSC